MPDKPRIVIDTNVLISQQLNPRSFPAQAFEKAVRTSVVLLSEATLQEFKGTLLKQKFDRYLSIAIREKFLAEFEAVAVRVPVHTTIQVCRDPKDDKFLELAVDGHADLIPTGDNDLLALHPFRGIAIIAPKQYLAED